MDELTKEIQDELPWCMLFTDDMFLLMRLEKELMISWSDGGIHWNQEVLK